MSINNAAGASSTNITDFSELLPRDGGAPAASTVPPASKLQPRRRPKIKPIAYGLDDNDYPFESDSEDEELQAAECLKHQLLEGTTIAQQKYFEHEVDGVTNMLGCAKVIDKVVTAPPPSAALSARRTHHRPQRPTVDSDDDSLDEDDLNMSETELDDIANVMNECPDDGNAGIDMDDHELQAILSEADGVFKEVKSNVNCPVAATRPRKPLAIDIRKHETVKLVSGSDVFAPISDGLTAGDLNAWNMLTTGNDNGNICDKSCQTDISCFDPDLLKHLMLPIESRCKKPFRAADARNSNDFIPIKRHRSSYDGPIKYESNY